MDLFFICINFCLCHIVLSVSCSLVVTCWERADLLTLLYVMFFSLAIQCPVSGEVLDSINSLSLPSFLLSATGIGEHCNKLGYQRTSNPIKHISSVT